ncbi:hypothetical protein D9M68_138630 [compost metagenome]
MQQHHQAGNPEPAYPARKIAGPWPNYTGFRAIPEEQRWIVYESAKAYRRMLEENGFEMSEPYDAFIKRVTDELEI